MKRKLGDALSADWCPNGLVPFDGWVGHFRGRSLDRGGYEANFPIICLILVSGLRSRLFGELVFCSVNPVLMELIFN